MSQASRVWFITGASRGFGRELARQALARGDIVIGTSRSGRIDLDVQGSFHALPLDVSQRQQVSETIEHALSLHGRIDVVVNNAGHGLMGAIEEADEEQLRRLLDVNFFGAWHVIRAVLPAMRARRSGHIVTLSSIAGLLTMPGMGLYCASKFALEGMCQSLAQELAPLGIHVTLIEPGSFRTGFLSESSLQLTSRRIDDYAGTAHAVVDRLRNLSGQQPGDPARVAAAIMQVVADPNPPAQLLLGPDAFRRMQQRQQQLAATMEQWRTVTLGTDL